MSRWAWAEVDLGAVAGNVEWLRQTVAPAELWAVVKAGGYGHGAVRVAGTSLEAGANGLCVALVQEGVELRAAGITAPILVLSEQPPAELPAAIDAGLQLTVYSAAQLAAIGAAGGREHPVHLKIDTGMRRVGAAAAEALALAEQIGASPAATLAGVCTHLAVADEPEDPYTHAQLDRFDVVLDDLSAAGYEPALRHAANSAGALAHPRARYDMVRCGIAVYGLPPGDGVAALAAGARPAMSLHARVGHVKRVAAGDRLSYGLRYQFDKSTTVATIPIGYADGVPRRLFECGGEVLISGRRRPIVGVVTMDQLMVDCGDDPVAIGDGVVLIGRQGAEEITATEWASRLGTINYEIVCGLSARVERHSR